MLSARRAAKQLESLTLLQQEEEHRLREQQLQQKVDGLQESLREVTERSGKVRAQYERYNACSTYTRSSRARLCCSVRGELPMLGCSDTSSGSSWCTGKLALLTEAADPVLCCIGSGCR